MTHPTKTQRSSRPHVTSSPFFLAVTGSVIALAVLCVLVVTG
jgi:hypothetical protein